jgi:MFS family permease
MLAYAAQQARQSPMLHPSTQEDRNARLLYLNTAMIGVATGGIAAFLPVFLARLGASTALMGWLNSAPSLLLVFLLIPGAVIAERHPNQVAVRCKYSRILRSAYLVCALAPFVVPTQYLPVALLIIWTATVLPEAVAQPSWTAVLANAISPRRRATVNSVRWALLAVVSAAASAFFGWLLDRVAFPYNYQAVFFLSWAFSWADPYFFSFIKIPPLAVARAEAAADVARRRSLWRRFCDYIRPVLHSRSFLVFLAATLPYRLALNLPAPLFSLFWVNELEAPDTLIGLRGTVGHGVLVAGYLVWGRLANRVGHRKVLMWSAGTLALYPIATALSPTAIWLLPAAAIWGFAVAGVDIGLFDMMLAACPTERQPLFAAVWTMVARAAMFLGPLIGAALSEATSLGTALLVAGVAQGVTILFFYALPHDV